MSFKKQLEIIENEGIKFIHPKDFKKSLLKKRIEKYCLQLMMVFYHFMKMLGQF